MKKRWHILTPDQRCIENISNLLKLHHITSSVLVNRGINTPEQASSFIHVALENIRSPFGIKDIDSAAKRIFSAINKKEKVLIFGDYDADGITATAILLDFLTYTGTDTNFYIPHRKNEGYGLQEFHISDHAISNQIDLIITADCGSSSHDAVSAAKEAGIDIIVIDHHNISHNLPRAEAVVNPKRHDCDSFFHDLSAVGMVFCVLICLRKHMRDKGFWKKIPEPNLKTACDLVALGTMADIVPLINENRIFLKAGLDVIRQGKRPGVQALIEISNIHKGDVDEQDIAFKLAPRLNAAGRVDHAKIAVELLVEKDMNNAAQIARSLNTMNTKRQQIERTILNTIETQLNTHPHLLDKKTLVLADERWDEGVLGIVASKLVDRYYRPVVLFAVTDGTGKGSARSIPGFDLYGGLQSCSEYLLSFGGHKMAAGLKIEASNIDIFKNAFDDVATMMTKSEDLNPVLPIDIEIDFADISEKLIDEIEHLKPFGCGNEEPVFMSRDITVVSSDIVGKNHRRMHLRQYSNNKNKAFSAIRFTIPPGFESIDHFDKIAFQLRWNRWKGHKSIQLIILDSRPHL